VENYKNSCSKPPTSNVYVNIMGIFVSLLLWAPMSWLDRARREIESNANRPATWKKTYWVLKININIYI
jgi:hypothetical protein